MQVARKGPAFIQDQRDAVIAVPGRVQDLAPQPDACQKFSALSQVDNEIIILCDWYVGKILAFEIFRKGRDAGSLEIQNDEMDALQLELLDETRMVWVEMCDQQVFDLVQRNPFPF